jgi:outer membrane biosynthesis protein TonB
MVMWFGTGVLQHDSIPVAGAKSSAKPQPRPSHASEVAHLVEDKQPSERILPTAPRASRDSASAAFRSIKPNTAASDLHQPDAPTISINEVLPDVPRSALQTIHGTIRVSIRLLVDEHGTVLTASPHIAGPSRYFERLALESAKKWIFTPANAQQRTLFVRFYFRRQGVTAHLESAHTSH